MTTLETGPARDGDPRQYVFEQLRPLMNYVIDRLYAIDQLKGRPNAWRPDQFPFGASTLNDLHNQFQQRLLAFSTARASIAYDGTRDAKEQFYDATTKQPLTEAEFVARLDPAMRELLDAVGWLLVGSVMVYGGTHTAFQQLIDIERRLAQLDTPDDT